MRYKCIILDHDDTVVDSTRNIHYPSFMSFLKLIRPGVTMTFEEYICKNFHPGFAKMCLEEFKFTDKEMEEEVEFWKNYLKTHIPEAYKGFKDLLHKFKEAGGIICVVSHSLSKNIFRDYEKNDLPAPDEVYGWERPEEERKPSPFPVLQIMQKYNLKPHEVIMIDDLKPGFDMAKKSDIDFAAAGWAYELPEVKNFMKQNSDYYLETVESLEKLIL